MCDPDEINNRKTRREWSWGCERSIRVETDGVVGQVKEIVAAGAAGWWGGGKGKSVGVGVLLLLTKL